MNLELELAFKGMLCLLSIPVVLRLSHAPKRFSSRKAGQWLMLTAVVAVLAYVNLGNFHGRTSVHYWEQYHYFLGSKYFPELGYDGLYAASIVAQMETAPGAPLQPVIRDLRTNKVVTWAETADHRRQVRERFSEERWQLFLDDHGHFYSNMAADYLYAVRKDHGYNPTPTWTFMARLLTAWMPANRTNLVALGLVDPLLLLLAIVMIGRTYGSRIAAMSVVIFGLGYAWRYEWIGGAVLRLDWLAAIILAVCLVKRKRFASAGACLAYGALVRLFPLAFLFGPAVLFVRALYRKEPIVWAWRMVLGFVVVIALGLGAGASSGRGPQAWQEFTEAIELHRETWLTNNVGAANLLLYGPQTMKRELVDWSLPEPWTAWQEKMDRWKQERRAPIAALSLTLLALIAIAAWQGPLDEAIVLGVGALFAVFLLTCYYWAMLMLIPIRGGRKAAAAAIALSAGLFGLHLATPSFEMIFGMMSWALLLLLLAWVTPDVRRALHSLRHGDSQ